MGLYQYVADWSEQEVKIREQKICICGEDAEDGRDFCSDCEYEMMREEKK